MKDKKFPFITSYLGRLSLSFGICLIHTSMPNSSHAIDDGSFTHIWSLEDEEKTPQLEQQQLAERFEEVTTTSTSRTETPPPKEVGAEKDGPIPLYGIFESPSGDTSQIGADAPSSPIDDVAIRTEEHQQSPPIKDVGTPTTPNRYVPPMGVYDAQGASASAQQEVGASLPPPSKINRLKGVKVVSTDTQYVNDDKPPQMVGEAPTLAEEKPASGIYETRYRHLSQVGSPLEIEEPKPIAAVEDSQPEQKTPSLLDSAQAKTPEETSPDLLDSAQAKTQAPPSKEEKPSPSPEEEKQYLIRFNNVAIIEFINFISRITNRNFVFDDGDLNFRVTVVSSEPTSIDNIMSALLQELRVHNLSLIEVGNNLIIHRNPTARGPGSIVTGPEGMPKTDSDIITRVFNLSNTNPVGLLDVIRPLLSDLAVVEAAEETHHLIVTDIAVNIEKIDKLVAQLDTPSTTFDIGNYAIINANPNSLIELAQKIMTPIAQDKPLFFVSHPAQNSVYIISTPYLVEKALAILEKLDAPRGTTQVYSINDLERGGSVDKLRTDEEDKDFKWKSDLPLGHPESTRFFVYKLQYREGGPIQDALSALGDSISLAGVEEANLLTTISSVQWIGTTNALIFTGTEDSIERVKGLVKELDTPARQVLIEVLVLETTIDDALGIGVEWGTRFGGGDTAGSQAFLRSGSPLVGALDNAIPNVALDPSGLARNAGFNMGVVGRNITAGGMHFNSLGALVSALHVNTKSKVVMNPKVLVEENTPAKIFAGINTRFQTQAISNDEGSIVTSNFEFRDVGSTVEVTPFISSDDMITLVIDQEVSTTVDSDTANQGSSTTGGTQDVSQTSTSTPTDVGPTTRRSTTKTKVHVPNGYFVILSGMILDQNTRSRTQIPCLGGLPIIGGGFSQKNTEDSKRNLLLFIRPTIVENKDLLHETKREQDIFREKSRTDSLWEQEVDETLDLLNVQSTDPDRWE